jgi:hypothetical protein
MSIDGLGRPATVGTRQAAQASSQTKDRRMSFMVYIDDYAAWSAASLALAQELASGYLSHGRSVKIIDYERSAGNRTWVYDYDQGAWLERAATGRVTSNR